MWILLQTIFKYGLMLDILVIVIVAVIVVWLYWLSSFYNITNFKQLYLYKISKTLATFLATGKKF